MNDGLSLRGWSVRGLLRPLVAAVCAASMLTAALPVHADVKTTTQRRYYTVGGSTVTSLVAYLRSHPIRGDHGNAIANVHPTYSLSVATKTSGGICRPSNVTLRLRFLMTLPRARSLSSMNSSTRSAWSIFASYAKRHEERHRTIYIQCGNGFVANAKAMKASNCVSLQQSIRRLLEKEKRACEVRQRAYDRAEKGRIVNLSLFRMARGRARRR